MAAETKIGLLVGLAFIVCFAVILSHRGQGEQLSARAAYELMTRHRQNPEGEAGPARREGGPARREAGPAGREGGGGRLYRPAPVAGMAGMGGMGGVAGVARESASFENHDGRSNQASSIRDSSIEIPRIEDSAGGGDGSSEASANFEVHAATGGWSWDRLFGGGGAEERVEDRVADADEKTDIASTSGAAHSGSDREALMEVGFTPVGQSDVADSRERTAPGTAPGKAPSRDKLPRRVDTGPAFVDYEVQSSDTLWKIAQASYGRNSKEIVDALYAANRDRLASPDKLAAGQTLRLPRTAGGAALAGDASVSASRSSASRSSDPLPYGRGSGTKERGARKPLEKKAGEGRKARTRSYQVQKGDRYATIAERFLGSKARWKEIYEINKDIFPEPGQIRYGVRIRIPDSASLASAR